MLKLIIILFIIPFLGIQVLAQKTNFRLKPLHHYLGNLPLLDSSGVKLSGRARILELDNRKGVNTTSIKSYLKLKHHTMNQPEGSVSVWFFALEDLSHFPVTPNLLISNPYSFTYPFLSDYSNPQDFNKASFKLVWDAKWHPNLLAQFSKGNFYQDAFDPPHAAIVSTSHFAFKKNTWYQLCLTWDYEHDNYQLFVNGILVAREDQFYDHKFRRDSINTTLFIGNPALCFSDIQFYDQAFNADEAYNQFRQEVTHFDRKLENELQYIYAGKGRKNFMWHPDGRWRQELSLDLVTPTDLDSFYVQGDPVKTEITKDGLLIETIDSAYRRELLNKQVYLWSGKPFEGDLYVEFEFNSLRPGGLSLLMVQASGMNREDFMADYPLRTSGKMTMVYGEDIRNYHWEYYREMADVRNDLSSSGLVKNPFNFPMSYSCISSQLEKNKWHKLQFLQEGNKIIGAVDGIMMIEATDNGFNNTGPVYNFGRIALRCMLHSKMLFRNLKVYNRNSISVAKQLGYDSLRAGSETN